MADLAPQPLPFPATDFQIVQGPYIFFFIICIYIVTYFGYLRVYIVNAKKKLMKSRIKKLWKYLATAVLGLLGFSSCGEDVLDLDILERPAMYGSPYADFKSLGTVKDEAGKPIEGIRVALSQTWRNSDDSILWIEADTVYTDTKGSYLLEKNHVQLPGEVTIVFEDIDGTENGGEFNSAEVKPDVKKVSDGGKGWDQGLYEAQADVVLNKK